MAKKKLAARKPAPVKKAAVKKAAPKKAALKKAIPKKAVAKKVASKKAAAPAKKIASITNAGKRVSADDAIRERLRLYPLALDYEIVAMLALDGIKVDVLSVQRLQREQAPK